MNQFNEQLEGARAKEAFSAATGPTIPPPLGPGASWMLINRFWANLRDIILRPSKFFAESANALVAEGGLSSALAFAVIVQWLASFFNFLWRSTMGVVVQSRIDDMFRIADDVMQNPRMSESLDFFRERALEFLFGAGAIILTPFTTLVKLAFTALLIHAAVRFFAKEASDRKHSYATTLKILAYSSAPWILCVIPGIGVLIGWILVFSAAAIGIREVYRTTMGRAILIVAFPELLFCAFLFAIGVFFVFLAFHALRLIF